MHLHFQSNQKKCKVRHGASNNIKYLGFSYTGIPNRIPLELWKRSRFSEGKKKRKGNARIWRVKKRKKIQLQNSGRYSVRIRRQAILALNARAIRSGGEAIWPRLLHYEACPSWASGETRVHSLLEEALGRGMNSPGTIVPARGWARARRDRIP
jgi:hypothetical protein